MVAVAVVALTATARAVEPTPVASVDPGARMLEGSSAGEYWDVSATFTGGARFFARYWVTNEGPGTHTGVAMGSFVGADGSVANFQYARDRGSWLLGAGGRYVQIASAVLDLREPSGRIEIDTDKYGLKIYLRFNMERAPRPLCARSMLKRR